LEQESKAESVKNERLDDFFSNVAEAKRLDQLQSATGALEVIRSTPFYKNNLPVGF
jgi:hypothetical protein